MHHRLPAHEHQNPTIRVPIAKDGRPTLQKTYTIPARQARAVRLETGQRLRLINPHGTQVCDLWAFDQQNPLEHLSMEHVRAALSKVTPQVGDDLVTNHRHPILRVVEDTSPGVHDTLIAACDIERYRSLGVSEYHDNCTHNLQMALAAIGCSCVEVPAPFNVWMNIPVDDSGRLGWLPPVAKPGDALTLEAAIPCIVVMSACPQDRLPVNGVDCVPRELVFEVIDHT